ncbi:unnamed protein product [Prunus armeniaca]
MKIWCGTVREAPRGVFPLGSVRLTSAEFHAPMATVQSKFARGLAQTGGSQGLPGLVSLRWKGIWALEGPVARVGPWCCTCSQTATRAILPGLDGPQLFGWMSPLEPILGVPGPFSWAGWAVRWNCSYTYPFITHPTSSNPFVQKGS